MLKDPVRCPFVVGLKVTVTVQLAPAARLVPQVVVRAKSPVVAMLLMVKEAFPVLLRVTGCAALVVLTFCELNVRLPGDKDTAGAGGGGD